MVEPLNGKRKRICVLFSGRGSNMASLVLAAMAPNFPAEVCCTITDNAAAGGIKVANSHNISCKVVDFTAYESRAAHEAAIMDSLDGEAPDLICLAGYMRLLSSKFVDRYKGRILNIHPSLLPLFKGLDTHKRALDAGVKLHGATVHHVDETLDGGQIIAQAAVPVLAGDSEDTLAARVLEAEHRLYPHAVKLALNAAYCDNETPAPLFSPPLGQVNSKY